MPIVSSVELSKDGPHISRLVAGMMRLTDWKFSTSEFDKWLNMCIDLGITSFDHADIYGDYRCEEIFGNILTPSLREKIQIISKCGISLVSGNRPMNTIKHYNCTQKHIVDSVEKSLHNLRTDHLDLLLIHRPDPLLDTEEVAKAFDQLYQSGKVLHFGTSNFSATQFEWVASQLTQPLVTNQVEYSVMETSILKDGLMDMCQKHKVSPMAWSPFGGGRLFQENSNRANKLRNILRKIASELNQDTSIDQVALAWILKHPAKIIPVIGSGKIERLASAAAATSLSLTREQWFRILKESTCHDVA